MTPRGKMNRRGFMQAILSAGAAPYVVTTVGAPRSPSASTIELNINANSWSAGWPETQRINMEYSNAHQHTNGRQLEFAFAQHSRPAGDHTSVRWTDFSADAPPKQGYYWPEKDPLIKETDNFPSAYLPWLDWVWLQSMKIIDIGGAPKAIFRNNDGSGMSFWNDFHELQIARGVADGYWKSNYNPACLVNPDEKWTCYFGGGVFTNPRGPYPPAFKILSDRSSTKPIHYRVFTYATDEAPIMARMAAKIGKYIYWGGAHQDLGNGKPTRSRTNRFYRIYIPDLDLGKVTQERITDCPLDVAHSGRFSLLAPDVPRKRFIYINSQGVFRYSIPADDSPEGTWEGPFTFGLSDWATALSGGPNGLTGDWHGFIGTHRSDLNQTFFRYNLSRRWNRIRWSS